MNHLRWFSMFALALGLVFSGCSKEGGPEVHEHSGTAEAGKVWHCPMHPQIVRDKPGSCPLCGMDLVPLEAPAAPDSAAAGDVVVDPTVVRKIGVRSEMVDAGVLGRPVRVEARVVLDQAAERSVTVRAMGYLEKVEALRPGDRVRRGQKLATWFAPDLVAAQGDWLASVRAGDSASAKTARERLLALGVADATLDEIARRGEVQRILPLRAGVDGWIRARAATDGQAVMAGQELFRLVEGTGLLLEARLPSGFEPGPGSRVDIEPFDGGKAGSAVVVGILPAADASTRTALARLRPEGNLALREGEVRSATFRPPGRVGIVVPDGAVLHGGKRDFVFLDLGGGRFRPVQVRTGPSAEGKTLVLDGLEAGDEVVVSAQFLLDSESRLQAALDQFQAGADAAGAHAGHGKSP